MANKLPFDYREYRILETAEQRNQYMVERAMYIRQNPEDFLNTNYKEYVNKNSPISFENIHKILVADVSKSKRLNKASANEEVYIPPKSTLIDWGSRFNWDSKTQNIEALETAVVPPELTKYLHRLHMIELTCLNAMNQGKKNQGKKKIYQDDFEFSPIQVQAGQKCFYGFEDPSGLKVDLIGQWAMYNELCIRLQNNMNLKDIDFYFACSPWEDGGVMYRLMMLDPENKTVSKKLNLWIMMEQLDLEDYGNKFFYWQYMGFNGFIDFRMRIKAELRLPFIYRHFIFDYSEWQKLEATDETMGLMKWELVLDEMHQNKIQVFNNIYGHIIQARNFTNQEIIDNTKELGGWKRVVNSGSSFLQPYLNGTKIEKQLLEKIPEGAIKLINDIMLFPYKYEQGKQVPISLVDLE